MGKYIVTHGQSLFDVALHIYGSVEGVTDLLINNESLSFDTKLKTGDELVFTDGYILNKEVVAYYGTHHIIPSTGERAVYPKNPTLPKAMEFYTSNKSLGASFTVWGEGKIEIDWGDNAALEIIELSDKQTTISHTFDNKIKLNRKITLSMEITIKSLDISGLLPLSFYILRPVCIERFYLSKAVLSIESLPLLGGVFKLCLNDVQTEDLTPLIALKELKELSLTGFVYTQPAIDAYLVGLVDNYDNRRSCRVEMITVPSPVGMAAIRTIINEPAWNQGGTWEFIINGQSYKNEQVN